MRRAAKKNIQILKFKQSTKKRKILQKSKKILLKLKKTLKRRRGSKI